MVKRVDVYSEPKYTKKCYLKLRGGTVFNYTYRGVGDKKPSDPKDQTANNR